MEDREVISFCYNGPKILKSFFFSMLSIPYLLCIIPLFSFYVSGREIDGVDVLSSIFLFSLPFYNWLVQILMDDKRPHIECIPILVSRQGFPLPEIVTIISTLVISYLNFSIKKKKRITWFRIFFVFLVTLFYFFVDYTLYIASIKQIILSTIYSICISLLFFFCIIFLKLDISVEIIIYYIKKTIFYDFFF